MADSNLAFFLHNPKGDAAAGAPDGGGPGGMYPETQPAIMWGQGTPNGDLAPFNLVNKGSLYLQVDATDDTACAWVKMDEGGDNADWRLIGESEGTSKGLRVTRSALYDISAVDSEQTLMAAEAVSGALTIVRAYLVWAEATGASGAAEGDITIGTASAGSEIAAATAYTASKAIGTHSDLVIKNGAVAAAGSVFASHDVAAGADGTYYLFLEWAYD